MAFNLRHPILSNRYVRQAIAHAINRDKIINKILPTYGIEAYPLVKAPVLPWWYYKYHGKIVHLFNDNLYEYDIAEAQRLLDLWRLSRIAYAPKASGAWVNGPVGDADFNGIVELDDLLLYHLNLGFTEAQMDAASTPGNDIDADFDNNNIVEDKDKDLYKANLRVRYQERPH